MSSNNKPPTSGRPKGRNRNPARKASAVNSLTSEMETLLRVLVENPIPTDANNRRITRLIPMYREVAVAYREGRANPPTEAEGSASASALPALSSARPAATPSHRPQAGGCASSGAPARNKPPNTTTATKRPEEMTATEWKAWCGRVIVSFEAWVNLLEKALECARRNDRVGYREIITERMWKVKVRAGD